MLEWCNNCMAFTNHILGLCWVCQGASADETTAELDTRELPAYEDEDEDTIPEGVTT
jgi:hypothetical protein